MRSNGLKSISLLFMLSAGAWAQSGAATGDIRGRVIDAAQSAIAGSSVSILNLGTGRSVTFETDATGLYRALELQPGNYEIRVVASGFEGQIKTPVPLSVGQSQVMDFELKVGALPTVTIDVTGTITLTEITRTGQATTIDETPLRNLPIDKRDYLTISSLAPGVADSEVLADSADFRVVQAAHSGVSFFGNNGRGNSISVDGAEANDSGGGVRPTLSQEAVAEFQINRSNYSAEFGNASGGVINIVSKTGTNTLHGSAYGFFRDVAFDAADPFSRIMVNGNLQRVKPPSNRQQFGAAIGGPIRRGKTFYFGAFEGLEREESNNVAVLTDAAIFSPTRAQEAILGTLPAPAAAMLRASLTADETTRRLFEVNSGVYPFSTSDYKGSVRLDHELTQRDLFIFRYNGSDIAESNPNARALLGASRSIATRRLDHTGFLNWTRMASGNLVNDLHYQFNYGSYDVRTADKFGPELNINGYGFFNRDTLLPSDIVWRRHEFVDNVSWVRGAHQMKFGGQALIRGNHVDSHTFLGGRFNFGELPGSLVNSALASTTITALQAFNLGLAQAYQQGFGEPFVISSEPYFGFFAQDKWQIANRLTLDLGIRYELDDLKSPIRTDTNNLAPRVGLAWDLSGDHKTTMRAGYGIYYAPTSYTLPGATIPLGESNGFRQIAQVLTTIQMTGPAAPPNIYRTLRAQGIITLPTPTRSITPSDLAQFGITISHTGPRSPLTVLFRPADDFASSYTQQASFGIEREVGSQWLLSANYQFVRGQRIMRARETNLLPAPISPTLGVRTWSSGTFFRDPSLFQDNIYESTGNSFYHGMMLEGSRRLSPRIRVTANYTLSKAIDEVVDYNSDFQANDQLNLRAERALSSFDQRHKVVAYAFLQSPWDPGHGVVSDVLGDFTVSPLLRVSSGRPFNLLVGTDLNGDRHSTTDRPAFAGRNTGMGPNFWTVDTRLTRTFTLGEHARIEFIGEAFNLLNRLNFRSVNNTVGNMPGPFHVTGRADLNPSQPLAFTSAFDARRFQLGARLSF